MSKVKRYDLWPRLQFLPGGQQAEAVLCFEVKDDGQWVRYDEYERLADEVALMKQLFEKHLTPEIRKAIVKEAKKGSNQ